MLIETTDSDEAGETVRIELRGVEDAPLGGDPPIEAEWREEFFHFDIPNLHGHSGWYAEIESLDWLVNEIDGAVTINDSSSVEVDYTVDIYCDRR